MVIRVASFFPFQTTYYLGPEAKTYGDLIP